MSRFFENILSEDHEHHDGEIIDLDVPHQSLKNILEFCALFDYQPIMLDTTPYSLKL
jgi:hypothetical protein